MVMTQLWTSYFTQRSIRQILRFRSTKKNKREREKKRRLVCLFLSFTSIIHLFNQSMMISEEKEWMNKNFTHCYCQFMRSLNDSWFYFYNFLVKIKDKIQNMMWCVNQSVLVGKSWKWFQNWVLSEKKNIESWISLKTNRDFSVKKILFQVVFRSRQRIKFHFKRESITLWHWKIRRFLFSSISQVKTLRTVCLAASLSFCYINKSKSTSPSTCSLGIFSSC